MTIEVRAGSTVFSPDTLPFTVSANDPDGLDSLVVTFLDSAVHIAADLRSETTRSFNWPVPSGLTLGRHLTIRARALDVEGLEGLRTADVTVVLRPSGTPFGR